MEYVPDSIVVYMFDSLIETYPLFLSFFVWLYVVQTTTFHLFHTKFSTSVQSNCSTTIDATSFGVYFLERKRQKLKSVLLWSLIDSEIRQKCMTKTVINICESIVK